MPEIKVAVTTQQQQANVIFVNFLQTTADENST